VRTVPIRGEVLEVLRHHRRRQLEERLAWGPAWAETGYVFTSEDGEPIHPQTAGWAFTKALRASDMPPLRFHDLRHTCASILLRSGTHPKVVSELLGHANVSITLNIYSHLEPGMK
jgi:integrase